MYEDLLKAIAADGKPTFISTGMSRHLADARNRAAMYGSDRAASIEPSRFRTLLDAVRKIHKAMGDEQIGHPITEEVPIARQLRAHVPWDACELNGVFRGKTDGT